MKAVNFKEIDLTTALTYQPSRIQFNNVDEWKTFENTYKNILSHRRDWYFNSDTLILLH